MDECILWTGHIDKRHGYGTVVVVDHRVLAHRHAWEQVHGPIPEGVKILHRCDNPPCVNVEHLFAGSQSDNVADMNAKGRHGYTGQPGEGHHAHRLTETNVQAIRARYDTGSRIVDLARRYDVAESTIVDVVKRRTWKHVP